MTPIEKLPPPFKRFRKKGGVLKFAISHNCSGNHEEVLAAIRRVIPHRYDVDLKMIEGFGYHKISERKFFGDWYDYDRGNLVKKGWHTKSDGSTLVDPPLKRLDGVRIVSGASAHPGPNDQGQFAYAFCCPPYPLDGRPSETQSLFEEIRDYILPPGELSQIYDWGHPQLPKASQFFEAGSEWWGMFLWSVYIPSLQKLTVIAGSTTD
ncbi:hypothetical protein P7228_08345 [Altererythrobacter arenosus]|uniref:Uncharacterized protein n=1 Tax=Altererythrobacter arenosus TaxID=3032592 RepID=A0ABY8FLX5_9SPHN|nr:hypothetical protein [Altererythrobacter sp. CAU 1644]WFL76020.1 hypothetical protein P7228_08345 [Altererythrobacter sp. CAU 1644]